MKIKVIDKKHDAYALFQLGYGDGRLFTKPSIFHCLAFEVCRVELGFSFNENRDNYEISYSYPGRVGVINEGKEEEIDEDKLS